MKEIDFTISSVNRFCYHKGLTYNDNVQDIMGPYNFETNIFWNFNDNTNHTELCIKNTSLWKMTQPL